MRERVMEEVDMQDSIDQYRLTVKLLAVIPSLLKNCTKTLSCFKLIFLMFSFSPQNVLMQQRGVLSNSLSLPRVSALSFKQSFVLALLRMLRHLFGVYPGNLLGKGSLVFF